MSQKHFKDDPMIGKCFLIEDPDQTIAGGWEVTDAWVDIGAEDNAPRNYSLERYDGEHDHGQLYYSGEALAKMVRWSPWADGHLD
jgi:hypothetical protein